MHPEHAACVMSNNISRDQFFKESERTTTNLLQEGFVGAIEVEAGARNVAVGRKQLQTRNRHTSQQ